VSKYRRKIFNSGSFSYFKELMKKLRDDLPEVLILEMNHEVDHIHLLVSIPPKMRVSDIVSYIKSQSGRLMKRKFEYMRKVYWGSDGIWSDGYFVSTVGVEESVIRK
jgi:putative transposase